MRLRAAVLGRPIAHSKSPLLHRAAMAALGLEDGEYGRFDVGADDLEAFLAHHPDQIGFSLTMPLKDRLVELATERGWGIDDTAALTGVANTVVRDPAATLVANTDVRGIVRALGPHLAGLRGPTDSAVIVGGGATARSAILACHHLGVDDVTLLVRSPERARAALDLCTQRGMSARTAPLDTPAAAPIVISTVPAEAAAQPVWSPELTSGVVLDVAYAGSSALLTGAVERGLVAVEGTAMLVEQAVVQFEMFLAAAGLTATLPVDPPLAGRIAEAMYAALDR